MAKELPEVPKLHSPEELRKVRPWDLFNKNKERVVESIQKERMGICKDCPFFIKLTGQCSKCGCIMEAKTRLAEAFCPEHKWGPTKINENELTYKESE